MTALFVTSSGTEVGKTFVTSLMLRQLHALGQDALGLKPLISGFDPDDSAESDSALLLAATGRPVTLESIDSISPWRFRAPLSPDMAAAAEGRHVPYQELVSFCRKKLVSHQGPVLIEGVGGVMVPLDHRFTVRDWIAELRIPALLVVGSYLGSLSHTLTALEALEKRRVPVRAVLISETEGSTVGLSATAEALMRFSSAPVRLIPRQGRGEMPDLTDLLPG